MPDPIWRRGALATGAPVIATKTSAAWAVLADQQRAALNDPNVALTEAKTNFQSWLVWNANTRSRQHLSKATDTAPSRR